MEIGDKIRISKGRLKGQKGVIIGTTDLNMNHRIIVRRVKGRNKIMGFRPDDLSKPRNVGSCDRIEQTPAAESGANAGSGVRSKRRQRSPEQTPAAESGANAGSGVLNNHH